MNGTLSLTCACLLLPLATLQAADDTNLNPKWKKMVRVNDPMMPVAWTWHRPVGAKGRVFTSTIGGAMASGSDFANESMRRMFVNACYWTLGLEDKIPAEADVTPVDDPNPFKRGVKPADASR